MSSWEAQQEREAKLLALERAGGISQGTGLAGTVRITHTTGNEGEGKYASFVILTVVNNDMQEVSIPISADWCDVMHSIIGSLQYHAGEANRITRERRAAMNIA